MRITATSTTSEILREFGTRLQATRLQQNMTAAQLARLSGVSLRSVNRAEAGENISLETMIKMLRAADRLGALESFLPAPLASPLQLAAVRGQARQRASTPRKKGPTPLPASDGGRDHASS